MVHPFDEPLLGDIIRVYVEVVLTHTHGTSVAVRRGPRLIAIPTKYAHGPAHLVALTTR